MFHRALNLDKLTILAGQAATAAASAGSCAHRVGWWPWRSLPSLGLRKLQVRQMIRTLPTVCVPPRTIGMMWSSCLLLGRSGLLVIHVPHSRQSRVRLRSSRSKVAVMSVKRCAVRRLLTFRESRARLRSTAQGEQKRPLAVDRRRVGLPQSVHALGRGTVALRRWTFILRRAEAHADEQVFRGGTTGMPQLVQIVRVPLAVARRLRHSRHLRSPGGRDVALLHRSLPHPPAHGVSGFLAMGSPGNANAPSRETRGVLPSGINRGCLWAAF